MNIKRCCYLVGLYLSLAYLAHAQPVPGTLVDKIVANIDNEIILESELEIAYRQYLLQGGKETPDLKCKVLESLILDKALLAKAKQEGITTAKEQLAQRLEQTIRYLVAQAGSEEAGQVIKNISATPQEVKSFFETLSVQERPFYPTEVVVRQIVQYPQISEREKAALCEQLAAFRTRIQQGESFEALAREHSQDPGSASKGGEIGFWRLGELAPEYEAAALALEPDELSQPVNTQFGFHLIQLIAREGDRYNSRHILFKPSPEVVDIEVAKTSLTQLRDAILAGKLTFEEAAKTSSEDTTTASAGGLITGKQGEIRMAIDDLSPDVFFAVEQLAQGSISKPVEFTTPDNRQAARILLLEEKRPAHEASLDQDYTKIQELLINKKRVTAFQAWLKDVQASVSIKVAPEYRNCEMLK